MDKIVSLCIDASEEKDVTTAIVTISGYQTVLYINNATHR